MQLSNQKIQITVLDHGAELASLRSNGREYLWQADAKYWKRHSPVLFPIVGAVWNGEYRSHGKTFKMGQHGFARDMEFQLIEKTDDSVLYCLESNDETLAKYPYKFRLEIGYKLIDNRVKVIWKVINTGDEEMAFQIGAHPAFHWPMLTNDEIEGGVEAMDKALSASENRGFFIIEPEAERLPISVITEKGCIGDKDVAYFMYGGFMELDTSTFDNDALIFENGLVDKVTLCYNDRKPYLSLEFDSPLVGLWSPPKKNAPFVCIEPWYGRTDPANYDGDFENKPWINKLAAGEKFEAEYDIVIE